MSEAERISEESSPIIADDRYFTFLLDGQQYAIPVANVVQIVGLQPLTVIPESPHYMKGLINVRGELIPVTDTRLRLSLEETENDERTSVVITHIGSKRISFIVDAVSEVTTIPKENFTDSGKVLEGYQVEYITGVSIHSGKTILHLDLEKLFGADGI